MRHTSSFALFFTFLPGLADAHPGNHGGLTTTGLLQHLTHDPFHTASLAVAVAGVTALAAKVWKKRP